MFHSPNATIAATTATTTATIICHTIHITRTGYISVPTVIWIYVKAVVACRIRWIWTLSDQLSTANGHFCLDLKGIRWVWRVSEVSVAVVIFLSWRGVG